MEICHLRQKKEDELKPLIYCYTEIKSFVTYLKVLQRVLRGGCNKIKRFRGDMWGRYKTRKLGVCAK